MKWWRIITSAGLLLFLVSLSPSASADTIVRGFKSEISMQPGLIVALKDNGIELSPGNQPEKIYGVVIDPSQAPVTVRNEGEQVFVATAGSYPVFVSTENGTIKAGDYVSISSINGIGAKANQQSTVVGRALEDFDGKSSIVTTASGGQAIGRVLVGIVPGKNPLVKNEAEIPAFLKRYGDAIAGKQVSAPRIYAALFIFVIASFIATSVMWIGIRSGMVAIGRNPLSKKSIMRSLFQVISVAFLVFTVGMIGVYLLLRL